VLERVLKQQADETDESSESPDEDK